MFLDEITSLLLSRTDNKLSLENLSTHYYTTFKRQINLTQLGYDSLLEAVSNLSNIKVIVIAMLLLYVTQCTARVHMYLL